MDDGCLAGCVHELADCQTRALAYSTPHVERQWKGFLGCVVQTTYGWGLVTEDEPSCLHVRVALDWKLRGGQRAEAIVCREHILDASFCPLGQCVQTMFGCGVLVDFRRSDGCHIVRLWRARSERGSGLLYCQKSAIRRSLSAAPGFRAVTHEGPGLVTAVHAATGSGTVQYSVLLDRGGELMVDESQIRSEQALAMPLAEKALALAQGEMARCTQLLKQGVASQWHEAPEAVLSGGSTTTSSRRLSERDLERPDFSQRSAISVESLLGSGIARFQEIAASVAPGTAAGRDGGIVAASGSSDSRPSFPVATPERLFAVLAELRCACSGVQPDHGDATQGAEACAWPARHPAAETASASTSFEENLAQLAAAVGLQRDTDMQQLAAAVRKDGVFQDILRELSEQIWHTRLAEDLLATRTAQAVLSTDAADLDPGKRLKANAQDLRIAGGRHLGRLKNRAVILQSKLLQDPVVCQRVSELLLGSWQCLDEKLAADSKEIAVAAVSLASAALSRHARILGNVLGGLEGLKIDHLKLDPNDLVGHNGAMKAAVGHLEQSVGQALQNSQRDPRLAGALVLQEFLDQVDTDETGLSRDPQRLVQGLLKHTLDNEDVAGAAVQALEKGERMMQRVVSKLQDGGGIDRVLSRLEAKLEGEGAGRDGSGLSVLEHQIRHAAERFDTGAFLADFQQAVHQGADAREGFMNRLLDYVLDGILHTLPSIQIPETSGSHLGVHYTVPCLDMSGLQFRREDVRLRFLSAGQRPRCPSLGLSMKDASAKFPQLRCTLRPKLLPEANMLTTAVATGISLEATLAASGGDAGNGGVYIAHMQLDMDKLEIKLDNAKYARLFNPLAGRLQESLKRHILASLKDRLRGALELVCSSLGEVLVEVRPLLAVFDLFPTRNAAEQRTTAHGDGVLTHTAGMSAPASSTQRCLRTLGEESEDTVGPSMSNKEMSLTPTLRTPPADWEPSLPDDRPVPPPSAKRFAVQLPKRAASSAAGVDVISL
eukprot:TRINITY_DN52384_c0_g2_i1.p1 TRINITY_DN52384_c0_g2~~TRINITY_DN52384_c0_g2_i1.p1  ORF type:complete len:1001 (+),score=164.12 TRINITY_DN52384_c0_g2_i1:149-3151(+)